MAVEEGQRKVVETKSAWTSKINWTQLVAMVASITVLFGINISPEDQVKIVVAIQIVCNLVTVVIKTWFTPTVTPQSIEVERSK